MLTTQIIEGHCGKAYKIITNQDPTPPRQLQAKWFLDILAAQQFIRTLHVPINYWRQLLQKNNLLPNTRKLDNHNIEEYICQQLFNEKIKAYVINLLSHDNQSPKNHTIGTGNSNIRYHFTAINALLINNNYKSRQFSNQTDAPAFLDKINPDTKQLQSIAKSIDIKQSMSSNASQPNSSSLNVAISKALASDQYVIIEEHSSTTPPAQASQSTNNDAQGPGNRFHYTVRDCEWTKRT